MMLLGVLLAGFVLGAISILALITWLNPGVWK